MGMIRIDKDSYGTIAKSWAITAVVAVIVLLLIHNPWIWVPIILVLAFFAFFVFWFHRLPDRAITPGDDSLVTAVADGKVVIVDEVFEKEYFGGDCIQVSVYMDFFDVHANYWPIDGEISLDEAVYRIKRDTRHFAKRQLTWFKAKQDVIWINKDEFSYDDEKILDFMESECKKRKIL